MVISVGRPSASPDEILTPGFDYNAPLDALDQIPPRSELLKLPTAYRRCRFIHALMWAHSVTWACRYAALDYSDVYGWKKQWPAFKAAWEHAQDVAGGDWWEDRLVSHASQNTPAAVTATIVGLKMRKRFVEGPSPTTPPIQIQIINVHAPGQELPPVVVNPAITGGKPQLVEGSHKSQYAKSDIEEGEVVGTEESQ